MNAAALIFSLIGAALSFFQSFIVVPFLGEISLDNIWGLILSNLPETWNVIKETWNGLSGFGETIIFIIIALLVLTFFLTPLIGIKEGFRAFIRSEGKEDGDRPWEQLRGLSIICIIAAAVLYFAGELILREMSKEMGENGIFLSAILPAHSVFLSYVPLIWAACFGIASACANADMKEQNKQKQNVEQQTDQLKKLQEQLAKMQEDMNKISEEQSKS